MHYYDENSYLFINGVEMWKSKVKDSKINAALLRLSNVPKGFSAENTENE